LKCWIDLGQAQQIAAATESGARLLYRGSVLSNGIRYMKTRVSELDKAEGHAD